MVERKQGKIVNTASVSAYRGGPLGGAAYCAAKAGVLGLTRELAMEWARYNVNVNSISPGYMKTEMTLATMTHLFPVWESLTPIGRLGEPKELRGAVLYLASDASSYMMGHDLVSDGGYTAR